MLVYSIFTSAAQRLAVLFAMSALTTPAEIHAMVNVCSVWCCWFKDILTKYDSTLAYFPQLGNNRYTDKNCGSVCTNRNGVLTCK